LRKLDSFSYSRAKGFTKARSRGYSTRSVVQLGGWAGG